MKIAFCYNVKRGKPSTNLAEQEDIEFDLPEVIHGIKKALEELGHEVYLVEADENAFLKLRELRTRKDPIDLVFTIAEGLWGDARESQIAMICEILQIPYTHSNPTTHAICLDKDFTKLIVNGTCGFCVPKSFIVQDRNYKIPENISYPLIVKPNKEGSSKGIMDANVVDNEKDLRDRVKAVSADFKKEVIVEEYIDGREFTVSLLGNGDNLQVLPIIEQKFNLLPAGMHKIASYELKWVYDYNAKGISDVYECPAKLDKKIESEIEETSKAIYNLLDVRDCGRLDFRLTPEGKLYFLEINTLPGLNPDPHEASCFPYSARVAGLDFSTLVGKIIKSAAERYHLKC